MNPAVSMPKSGLLALLCGALVPLGFAPLGWYPMPLVALALLVFLLHRRPPGQAFLLGWLFGMGQFGIGVSWVYISIYLYGNASLALSMLVMLLFVAFLAMYPALMAWVMAKTGCVRRNWFFTVLFPVAWVLSEWLRSWLFSGFPWLNLGYSQVQGPLLGVAPVLGAYGVGWLSALSAGLLAWMVQATLARRLLATAVLAAIWLSTYGLGQLQWSQPTGEKLKVAIVQGNISQDLKWKPEQQQATLERYVEMTRRHADADLVVWPETAIPAFYDELEEDFIEPLRNELQQQGQSLVTGIPVLNRDTWKYYNSVISLDQPGHFYYKVHLVPFGEYLPLRSQLAGILNFLPVPQADFSAGRTDQPLLQAAGYPFGASICYEIVFGEQLINALPRAAFLVNVSNDAWFGRSLAPHQHLEMARMRAREVERYLIRATNTGFSAVIGPDGRDLVQSGQFTTEVINAYIQPRSGATPYVRWGNWPVLVTCWLLLLVSWIKCRSFDPPVQ
jgi:apolipoprotein N-acyltransferase